MIRYVLADDILADCPLRQSMFRDRAIQFRDRLKWKVNVNANGEERDQYDELNPLYVIWEGKDGLHGGSMRFMPTLGKCMVNDHFLHVTGGRQIKSSVIWECTRFCLAPGSNRNIASALMLAGGELMLGLGIEKFVGVFDARMVRIYNRIGAPPKMIGSIGRGRNQVSVGLWSFSKSLKETMAKSAGIPERKSREWFDASKLSRSNVTPIAA
ncbi:acyl-homoserine-lactone synthase [Antarctobacter jejuensis]|uniref:acyl-homoserine-lactone synthase n=1 Tax=Antarctobacter jejuensis TaxID=1439938 RepID=UPI003FD2718F